MASKCFSLILENLPLFLSEMCKAVHEMTGLEASASTLYRVTHRHGLARKKIQVAKQRSDVYRGQFMDEIQLHWEQFIWIDETGCAAKDHITCPEVCSVSAVSRSIAKTSKSWRIKVIAFRIVTLISVRHETLSNSHKKKTLLVGAQTLKIENSVAFAYMYPRVLT